jgi:hypothetical protein
MAAGWWTAGMANLTDHPDSRQRRHRRPNFAVLWVIVSGLWTLATVSRMQRIWVPILGWPTSLGRFTPE